MLFNSYIFIFVFLPIVLLGFHIIGKSGRHRIAISWLVAASLFFYGWWNPMYLGFILASIIFNYAAGVSLSGKPSKVILTFGIIVNLSLIGYFKYAEFFVDNINVLIKGNYYLESIVLPLAISFFTFQQITYLVDAHRGLTKEYNFLHYCLFVTFFPQLIAGPIVHHKEMLPQFASDSIYKLKASNLSVGVTLFILGLFKKVVFADSVATYATPVFAAAENGVTLTFFEAWGGALAYTFQLYFDFSGYSDMALGLARMFGVTLPVNFYSPYKANNIIEFWRRWHITLSRFLRDYLYIPLGGNRKGELRRYINLFITMLLGGFWHGAGWTFIIWGGMHGILLSINYGWKIIVNRLFPRRSRTSPIAKYFGRLITFISVTVAWVMFRAESVDGALGIYSGMFGYNGISIQGMFHSGIFYGAKNGVLLLFALLIIVWFTPNTVDWLRNEKPALGLDSFLTKQKTKVAWIPNIMYALLVGVIAVIAIMYIQQESEFLYFQF